MHAPVPQPAAESGWIARLWDALGREATILGLLLLAGLLLRLPYLWDVPRFTDELQEILWAFAIYRGEILPLTAVDSYYGPLWSYLLAATFLTEALGADLALVPRVVATLLALVTIAVAYGVARDLAGRRAAFIVAAFMVTSGGHVIINSHTARSNSITPLLTTLLVWALIRAIRSGDGRLLVVAGFLFALSLQTHVSVIAIVPGLALGLLLFRRRLVISRWAVAGIAAFVVGYSNMLIYNVQTGFWSLVHARALQQGYTGGRSLDPAVYFTNLSALVESLSRLASGTIDRAGNPAAIPYVVLGIVGLLLLARRGVVLPLLFCLSMALVLPYFNPRYGPILSGRYIVPLLPFLYLGIAVVVEAGIMRLPMLSVARRRVAVHVASAALILFPLAPLVLYYRAVLADERTNAPLFQLSGAVDTAYRPGDLVLVDEATAQESLTAGGTDLKAIRMLLEADGIPYRVAKLSQDDLAADFAAHGRVLVVIYAKNLDNMERQAEVTALSPEIKSASGSGHEYAVYEVRPRRTP